MNNFLFLKKIIKMDNSIAHKDFQWVIKVLQSSKNDKHLDCTLNCFRLWESKHVDQITTKVEREHLNKLRSIFWKKFRDKNNQVGILEIN